MTPITLITDCQDANAAGRQSVRLAGLFGTTPTIIGVLSDLEAAGNLIDALDAAENRPGVFLVNVAPRNGSSRHWPNGTPFAYFRYRESLVLASIEGLSLSLVKKLGLITHVQLLDIETACRAMIEADYLEAALAEHIATTQFRSFEFLPRAAHFLSSGRTLPSESYPLDQVHDAPPSIWWIDNFGNAKTTLWADEVERVDHTIVTAWGAFPFFAHLRDVPDNTTAIVSGSSGLDGKRFLELVIQGGHAAKQYGLSTGQKIFDRSLKSDSVSTLP